MSDERTHPAEFQPDGPEKKPNGIRYVTCPVCGQTVDMESLGQVHHHDGQPHEPLEHRPKN